MYTLAKEVTAVVRFDTLDLKIQTVCYACLKLT